MALNYSLKISETQLDKEILFLEIQKFGCGDAKIVTLDKGFHTIGCGDNLGFDITLLNVSDRIFPTDIEELDLEFNPKQNLVFDLNKNFGIQAAIENVYKFVLTITKTITCDYLLTFEGNLQLLSFKNELLLYKGATIFQLDSIMNLFKNENFKFVE